MEKYFRRDDLDLTRCLDFVSVTSHGERILLQARDNNEVAFVKIISREALEALRDVLNQYFESEVENEN